MHLEPVSGSVVIASPLMQDLWCRIVYPSAFNRAYRCVVKYIKSYVMEELANLIFIGCYIARCGPPGFKTLWMRLQPALWHYMYGRHDSVAQRNAAETSLKAYAARLEKYVIEGKVASRSQMGARLRPCGTCSVAMQQACDHVGVD